MRAHHKSVSKAFITTLYLFIQKTITSVVFTKFCNIRGVGFTNIFHKRTTGVKFAAIWQVFRGRKFPLQLYMRASVTVDFGYCT